MNFHQEEVITSPGARGKKCEAAIVATDLGGPEPPTQNEKHNDIPFSYIY